MEKERAGIQSVEVGFALLQGLAQARAPLMLKEVAAAAGMSAAKAHRYLVSFQRLGLVAQDNRSSRYDLGPASLQLGLAALNRLDPVRLARERLPALREALQHTVALAVWGNHGPTIVHWEESAQSVIAHLRLGDVMPLLSSATGRCFAAHLPAEITAHMLDEETQRARQIGRRDLPLTPQDLQAMLNEVRAQGTARVIDTLLPGIVAFCTPVFDSSGHMVMGITTLGSAATFDAAYGGAIDSRLRTMAQQLAADLGHASR